MNIDLRFRLLVGFSIAPVIMIVLNVIGIQKVNDIEKSLTTINDVNSVKQRYAINFRGSVHDRAISLRDVVLYTDSKDIDVSLKEIETLSKFYDESAVPLDKIFDSADVSQDEIALLKNIKDIEQKTLPVAKKVIDAKNSGNQSEAWNILMLEAKPAFSEWLARINKFIDYQENLNQIESKSASSIARKFEKTMLSLTLGSILASIVIGFFIAKSIVKSLNKVSNDLNSSSNRVSEVSTLISDTSQTLAKGANHQAEAIESITSSLTEMNEMLQRNIEGSYKTLKLASDSSQKASDGEQVVKKMTAAIDDIQKGNDDIQVHIDESNRQISSFVSLISRIAEKTKVINDIVFQTKLLSFNASVEAARAGENGKGFSVVAEEVGNLAKMSGAAAKEIFEMLNSSRDEVENIVSETQKKVSILIESGRAKVQIGTQIARQCNDTFVEIASKINDVKVMAEQISNATKEQGIGFQHVTKKIDDMDQITRKNAVLATETANALESLNAQSTQLQSSLNELAVLVNQKAA